MKKFIVPERTIDANKIEQVIDALNMKMATMPNQSIWQVNTVIDIVPVLSEKELKEIERIASESEVIFRGYIDNYNTFTYQIRKP
jgi:hypothetical protein